MSRRPVARIGPNLDISSHLIESFDALPSPWDPAALFGRRAALEVEIGSGKGLFLADATTAHPETDFLGVEIARKYARACAARLARREVRNGRVVACDAQRLFRELLPDRSVAAVHVYFPDPWWKKRHKKRRVLCEPLVCDVERVLAGGGTLHFWTDVKEYYDATLELLARVTALSGPTETHERPAEHEMDYHTHFERRTRLAGQNVYRCLYRKEE